MRLAPRLFLSFALLGVATVAALGFVLRQERAHAETERFTSEVTRACGRVVEEIGRQAERDERLVRSSCQSGELVDRALVALETGELDEQRVRFAALVPLARSAFDLDELSLIGGGGDLVGVDPKSLLGMKKADVDRIASDRVSSALRLPGERFPKEAALVSVCAKRNKNGQSITLAGARHIDPLLLRLGNTLALGVSTGKEEINDPSRLSASCDYRDAAGRALTISVRKSTTDLEKNLREIDAAVLIACLVSSLLSLLVATFVARSLGRPLSTLASEARKVASGEARPIGPSGTGEIRELAESFDKMLSDLSATRRRLAAASRIAAWREVARRVAHEVKNPLAPIQAAVETLRRLRARQDPAFEDYFDEASATVLTEVHRISTIVTEFTRFARLPPPRPEEVDVAEIVEHVVSLQSAGAGPVRIQSQLHPVTVRADRDQVIQVVTNLVQNAIEAARSEQEARVDVALTVEDGFAHITVSDNGAGLSDAIRDRLFEPYATTKASGTGLGLAIAQRIATDHGGELSYLGAGPSKRGASFRLSLPIEGPPPASDGTTASF